MRKREMMKTCGWHVYPILRCITQAIHNSLAQCISWHQRNAQYLEFAVKVSLDRYKYAFYNAYMYIPSIKKIHKIYLIQGNLPDWWGIADWKGSQHNHQPAPPLAADTCLCKGAPSTTCRQLQWPKQEQVDECTCRVHDLHSNKYSTKSHSTKHRYMMQYPAWWVLVGLNKSITIPSSSTALRPDQLISCCSDSPVEFLGYKEKF